MSAKAIVILCAQAFLAQTISAFCSERLAYDAPLIAAAPCGATAPWTGYGASCGYRLATIPTSSGGGFPISSASPIPPVGVSVLSENEIGGILAVGGELPFLGTVGLEGALPTAGTGTVSYGCGDDGAVAMISEDIVAPAWGYPAAAGLAYGSGFGAGLAYGPGLATGFGYGSAIAERALGGCGCGIY